MHRLPGVLLAVIAALLFSSDRALAQATGGASHSSTASSPTAGCWLLILVIWSVSRKTKPIGGCLFFYLVQTIISTLIGTLLFVAVAGNLSPSGWHDPLSYALILISSGLPFLLLWAIFVFSLGLWMNGAYFWVKLIRIALLANCVAYIASEAIDIGYFRQSDAITPILDTMGLVWSAFWLLYFYKSKRVEKVFLTKQWDGDPGFWS